MTAQRTSAARNRPRTGPVRGLVRALAASPTRISVPTRLPVSPPVTSAIRLAPASVRGSRPPASAYTAPTIPAAISSRASRTPGSIGGAWRPADTPVASSANAKRVRVCSRPSASATTTVASHSLSGASSPPSVPKRRSDASVGGRRTRDSPLPASRRWSNSSTVPPGGTASPSSTTKPLGPGRPGWSASDAADESREPAATARPIGRVGPGGEAVVRFAARTITISARTLSAVTRVRNVQGPVRSRPPST